jgi:hypothetical protein
MTRPEFMDEVLNTYFSNNCTVSESIDITANKLGISDLELEEWFRKGRNYE